jgi:hypothetical protein
MGATRHHKRRPRNYLGGEVFTCIVEEVCRGLDFGVVESKRRSIADSENASAEFVFFSVFIGKSAIKIDCEAVAYRRKHLLSSMGCGSRNRNSLLARQPRNFQPMGWDAPIAISVFRKRKGKLKRALCLSLYLSNRTLYIGQLQGVVGTDPPAALRPWARMYIEACRKFACQEKLREVRVPTAKSLYSYRNPSINRTLPPEVRLDISQRIRRDMELLYDTNALDLGFVPDGDWFRWQNPGWRAKSDSPSLWRVATSRQRRTQLPRG